MKTKDKEKAKDTEKPRRAAKKTSAASLQDSFLDELITNRTRVTIFLVNGVKVEGNIKSFDRYVILMDNEASDKLYKHAISTIVPNAETPAPTTTTIIRKKPPSKLSGRKLKP